MHFWSGEVNVGSTLEYPRPKGVHKLRVKNKHSQNIMVFCSHYSHMATTYVAYLLAFEAFWSERVMSERSFLRHRRDRPKEST